LRRVLGRPRRLTRAAPWTARSEAATNIVLTLHGERRCGNLTIMTSANEPSPWDDADTAIDRIQEQVAQAQATAAKAQEMQQRIRDTRGVAESRGGEVRATCDASGALTDLTLESNAADMSVKELGRVILETVTAARTKAGAKAIAIAEDLFGEDAPGVQMMRAEIDDREQGRASSGIAYS
jgi:DNA-binding protein YbaB